jgi:hypothetical protein
MKLLEKTKSRVITLRVEEPIYKHLEKISEKTMPQELKNSSVNKVNWCVKKMIIDHVMPEMAIGAVLELLEEAKDRKSKLEIVKAIEPEWGPYKDRIDRDYKVAEFDKKVFDRIDKAMKEIKAKEAKGKRKTR